MIKYLHRITKNKIEVVAFRLVIIIHNLSKIEFQLLNDFLSNFLIKVEIEYQGLYHSMTIFKMTATIIKMLLRNNIKMVPVSLYHVVASELIMMPRR